MLFFNVLYYSRWNIAENEMEWSHHLFSASDSQAGYFILRLVFPWLDGLPLTPPPAPVGMCWTTVRG